MDYPLQKLQINGLQMNVLIAGEGEPLLLVHGFPDTHTVWRKQIPLLIEAGYQVIAPDTRGCGDSEIPAQIADYHRDNLVEDLRALLLVGRSAVLAGSAVLARSAVRAVARACR